MLSRYELIERGIFSDYKKERYVLKKLKLNVYDVNEYPSFSNDNFLYNQFDTCTKMYNAISRRKTRAFKKMLQWYYYVSSNNDYMLLFGTLTFKDSVLKSTNKMTRRKYVSRFLNDNTLHYIANIDFSPIKNREHYHFVALVDHRISKGSFPYGFDKYSKVLTNVSLRSRKNYLMKLTNHTYKDSTKQERLISDRKKDKKLVVFMCQNIEDFEKFKDNFYLDLIENDKKL